MKKPFFTKKQQRILERSLAKDSTLQNLYSPKFGRTFLSDEIQHIRKKLGKAFDVSHDTVKKEILVSEPIEGTQRKNFVIYDKWRSKVRALLKSSSDSGIDGLRKTGKDEVQKSQY